MVIWKYMSWRLWTKNQSPCSSADSATILKCCSLMNLLRFFKSRTGLHLPNSFLDQKTLGIKTFPSVLEWDQLYGSQSQEVSTSRWCLKRFPEVGWGVGGKERKGWSTLCWLFLEPNCPRWFVTMMGRRGSSGHQTHRLYKMVVCHTATEGWNVEVKT